MSKKEESYQKKIEELNNEVFKLKKDLKNATKLSSMFSVWKNTMKMNIHDFFVRESKIKNMDSRIKKLEQELAEKEEELKRASAEIFAATHWNDDEDVSDASEVLDESNIPAVPQNKKDAVKLFQSIDLSRFQKTKTSPTEDTTNKLTEPLPAIKPAIEKPISVEEKQKVKPVEKKPASEKQKTDKPATENNESQKTDKSDDARDMFKSPVKKQTAVIGKDGKKSYREDRREKRKQKELEEIEEIEEPDYGIQVNPDMPDIQTDSSSIFADLDNFDGDWDDSEI